MRRVKAAWALLICALFPAASAQGQTGPPPTDIFIVELRGRAGSLSAGTPANITNRDGYDNQPMFLRDGGAIFYTSIREDGQADIYRYDLKTRSSSKVTDTKESEYSATVTPDGRSFSVIRVEADSTQRLWKFPLAGGEPALVLKGIKPVGYHAWLDGQTLALFILGEPNTLQLVDARTEKAEVVAQNIGRSLHRMGGGGRVSFVHKESEKDWVIKELDLKTRKITPITRTLPGSEDYAWTPGGSLLMAKESKLYEWKRGKDAKWREVADFSGHGIRGITRLAVSPSGDRLALVASPGAKP